MNTDTTFPSGEHNILNIYYDVSAELIKNFTQFVFINKARPENRPGMI
jgi:hypothetical protein